MGGGGFAQHMTNTCGQLLTQLPNGTNGISVTSEKVWEILDEVNSL